jgi:hypothetical protein
MASSISSKVVSYQKSLQKIQQRHQTWVQNTKPFLLELLEKTLKENPMDWYLGMQEYNEQAPQSINLESVSVHIKNMYSGIVYKTVDSVKSYVKYGGLLSYAQTYNRTITVTIHYPYIEQWVEKREPLFLGNFDPTEITEEIVIKHLEIFLDAMIEWEDNEREPIGFNFRKG